MLLVEGISDAGGTSSGGGFWSSLGGGLPLVISLIAIVFTATTLIANTRKNARDSLWSYLQVLVSAETARARSIVGEAARWDVPRARALMVRLSQSDSRSLAGVSEHDRDSYARDRDAIFQLLWVVALAAPSLESGSLLHRWVVGESTNFYRAQVYEHLNLIVGDLHVAYDLWIRNLEGKESGQLADSSLDVLPAVQAYDQSRSVKLVELRFATLAGGAQEAEEPQ